MTSVAVHDLHKSFGPVRVLRGVDLSVEDGSFTAVLGPSGSGKTTLLRILAGFERASRGTVELGSTVVESDSVHVPPERRRVGIVPQDGALFPHLDVVGNVAFGLGRGARRSRRIAELLDMVGLAGMGGRYPHQLSGGEQQRVALARALAIEPLIVLLDEPFASLDANLRASVRADVHSTLRTSGATVILVTHDQDEALSLADHVAVLRAGHVVQSGPPDEIYLSPVDADLARFVGEANLVRGTSSGGAVKTAFGGLPITTAGNPGSSGDGRAVVVLVRPEQIDVHPGASGPGLPGRVVRTHYYGHDAVLEVETDDPETGLLQIRVSGAAPVTAGAAVTLTARGPVVAWPA